MSLTSKLTIGALRQLVPQKQAWRELLGREEFLKLYNIYKKSPMATSLKSSIFKGEKIDINYQLRDTLKGKSVSILPSDMSRGLMGRAISLYDKEIYLKNIEEKIYEFERKSISLKGTPRLLEELESNKIFDKLYSNKYKSTRRIDEFGNKITTVIDRKTQEPIEVYVKKQSQYNICSDDAEELYHIFVRNKDGKEELIGRRSFGFDRKNKIITPGMMDAIGNDRYEGIGTRLHQIAVERLIQNDYKGIELSAWMESYPFHYKSLFRTHFPPEFSSHMNINEIKKSLTEVAHKQGNEITDSEFSKCIVSSSDGIDISKTIDNIRKLFYQKRIIWRGDLPMKLDGKNLEYWKELARSQPILLK